MAGLLIRQPDLLLLDEPTNHLDLDGLAWLEAWLQGYEGAVLLASHDRAFLEAVTTRLLVIEAAGPGLRDFAGSYSRYMEALAREREKQWQAYQEQQNTGARLRSAARHLRSQTRLKRGGKADRGDKFAKGFFANRSAGSAARAKQIEQRLQRLLDEGKVEKPGRQWQLRPQLAADDSGARQVLRLEGVSMAFDHHLLFSQVSLTLTHGQRVALIGPNGAGKTTLLRIIAGEMAPTTGQVHLGAGIKAGYMAQEQETLEAAATPYETIRAAAPHMDQTAARTFLHRFLFSGDEVFIPAGQLSFGERSRLMLARLVAQGCNFLLLDEPVNHLDIPGREHFEAALDQFPGTVLAVVHDRAFICRMATAIWKMRAGRITLHLSDE